MNPLHERALRLSRQHRRTEVELVAVLNKIETLKLHRTLGFASLFTYAVSALGLSEPVAYALMNVARKAREIRALHDALVAQKLSVSRASRIVAALTLANASALIEFAATHSQRETDQEVARLSDRKAEKPETLKVPAEVLELLREARAVMASRKKRDIKLAEALKLVLEEFLDRHEPVRKAERALKRAANLTTMNLTTENRMTEKLTTMNLTTMKCTTENRMTENLLETRTRKHSVQTERPAKVSKGRTAIAARVRHIVNARDQARCTFVDLAGNRCSSDRWLHTHHILPVSKGGGNEPANLTTLCSFHHDLVHQLGFAIEGQVNWIREPGREYGH